MKTIYIEWWDSSRTPGWNDAQTSGPMLCTSIGFEVHRDKKYITISASYNGGTQYCDQLTIPTSCIKKMRRYAAPGESKK